MDLYTSTILLPWVRILSTPSTHSSFIVKFELYFHVRRTKINEKEAALGPFKTKTMKGLANLANPDGLGLPVRQADHHFFRLGPVRLLIWSAAGANFPVSHLLHDPDHDREIGLVATIYSLDHVWRKKAFYFTLYFIEWVCVVPIPCQCSSQLLSWGDCCLVSRVIVLKNLSKFAIQIAFYIQCDLLGDRFSN